MAIQRNIVRLALEMGTPFGGPGASAVRDFFTNGTPQIPFARALEFQVALFYGGVLDPLTGLTSMTLELKDWANGLIDLTAPKISQTVAAGAFNTLLTADQWTNNQGAPSYHVAFTFTEAQVAGIGMTGNSKDYGLVVTGMGPDGRVDLASGMVTLVNSGGTGAGSGVAPVPSYTMSDQEIQAGLANKLNAGQNPSGVVLVLAADNDPTVGLMSKVSRQADGSVTIQWIEVPIIT